MAHFQVYSIKCHTTPLADAHMDPLEGPDEHAHWSTLKLHVCVIGDRDSTLITTTNKIRPIFISNVNNVVLPLSLEVLKQPAAKRRHCDDGAATLLLFEHTQLTHDSTLNWNEGSQNTDCAMLGSQ